MQKSDLFLDLFYNVKENSFKIKTNVRNDKVDKILSDCYRTTLNSSPDYREPNLSDIYNVMIKLDLSSDTFFISSDTGNRVLAHELIRKAINNWENILYEESVDKSALEEIILKNRN